jgi:hypothetical protein
MVVLPAPDQRHHLTWLYAERDVVQHLVPGAGLEHDHRFERGQRDFLGSGVREVDPFQFDGDGTSGDVDGVEILSNHGHDVEHFEQPVKGDQRCHHVELKVGELRQGTVQSGQVLGKGDEGAHLEGAPHGGYATDAIDHCGRHRRSERQRHQEDTRVGSLEDADVAHPGCLGIERLRLHVGSPQELYEHCAADVEAFLHDHVHFGVKVVAFLSERAQVSSHHAGRDEEDRKKYQRGEGDLPAEIEHRCQHNDHRDQVAHRVRKEIGEGLLRAENVVVQPADESAGLGPGKEGQGHTLDVPEHLRTHVKDQTLADDRRDAALCERKDGVDQSQAAGETGQRDNQVSVVLLDTVVDEGPQNQRVDSGDDRVEHYHGQEYGQDPSVGNGEGQHPTRRALFHAVLQNRSIPPE